MRTNTFFLLILLSVFFISGTAPAQQEEITLSTYYPAPYGEYDELCAEKLLVDLPSAAELQDMQEGDCHITRSMIVGSGIGTGFSYDELEGVGSLPANGDLLIRGYVGIGTPEPNTALDLDGAFSIRGIPTASAPPVAPVDEGRIYFDSDTDTFRVSQNGGAYDDLGTGAGGAFWAETATGNHIYNTNTGNVGIGTTDPSGGYKLKVIGPTKIQGGNLALLDASTTATSSGPSILLGTTGAFQKSSSYSGIHRRVISGTTCTQFTSGMADVMVLTDTGNVGIGTTDPGTILHIKDPVLYPGAPPWRPSGIILENNSGDPVASGNSPRMIFIDTLLGNVATAPAWAVDNWADRFRIWRVPNIYSLGQEYFTIYTDGRIYSGILGNLHVPSDTRLKKDITPINNALEKILGLRGVNFRWKDPQEDQSLQMGLIAQEVEKIIPEAVHTAANEMKTKAVEYQYMFALLVEAIKEQQKKIDNLEREITELKSQPDLGQ